jgi:hypothetical protein
MKKVIFVLFGLVSSFIGYSQSPDIKEVVGISAFSSDVNSAFDNSVAEKVVQVVTNTRRFTVVDRTSYDKVKAELEFQKSEAFLDSKNTVQQDIVLAAHYLIIGHIIKMNIYTMKNADGSVNGYKASAAFTLKINDVETGKTTEAESFQTEVSTLMLSKEAAVNEALKSVEPALNSYFSKTFPLTTSIVKILTAKKDAAATLLIAGGRTFGFKEGDKIIVERIEILNGKSYPTEIGELKVTKVAGDDFSECSVSKGGKEILALFNAAEKMNCKLIVK